MKNRLTIKYFLQFSFLLAFILLSHLKLTIAGPGTNLILNSGFLGFDVAAEQNSRLKTDLQWFFGGKTQRGWHLYSPLICRMLKADCDVGSRKFAQALYKWQQTAGLRPTGILDQPTWMLMVEQFQMARIKDRSPASSENLLQVQVSDFFDHERPADLRLVEKRTYSAYKRMVDAAISELSPSVKSGPRSGDDSSIKYLKIISAFRSPRYQAQLRRRSPRSGRAGLAVNSPHFTGCALDLYVGGDPVNTDDRNRLLQINTTAYKWLVMNAERFGFYPYFYEPWHWEFRLNTKVQGGKNESKHTDNHRQQNGETIRDPD